MVGYDGLIEKFKQKARGLFKQSATLEVTTHKKLVSKEALKSPKRIAVIISIEDELETAVSQSKYSSF